MDSHALLLAFALAMVIEGLLPFVSPNGWRKMIAQILRLKDGQIRFFGFCSIVLGLIAMAFLS